MAEPIAPSKLNVKNRKARFEYEILETFTAGIMLTGTEIKSVRRGQVNISESYCYFVNEELFIKNMHIKEYEMGNMYNHDPLRIRKLLLKRREIGKLLTKVKEKGLTITPLKLFISGKGWAKVEIALSRGKKIYDKRESIKNREADRESRRID